MWPAASMPLRYFIDEAVIPDELQDEFRPVDPAVYTDAVEQAISVWESELEGLVVFERVADPDAALLRFRVLAEESPTPDAELFTDVYVEEWGPYTGTSLPMMFNDDDS